MGASRGQRPTHRAQCWGNIPLIFFTLAEQTGWGQEALKSALLTNINDELKDKLRLRELPSSLHALMTLCLRVDDRVCAHRSTCARVGYEPLGLHGASTEAQGLRKCDPGEEEEEPMQALLPFARAAPTLFYCR